MKTPLRKMFYQIIYTKLNINKYINEQTNNFKYAFYRKYLQVIKILHESIDKECSSAVTCNSDQSLLTYAYEEGDNPDAFFVPFAWTCLVVNIY
jgi:hypothetical protein